MLDRLFYASIAAAIGTATVPIDALKTVIAPISAMMDAFATSCDHD
jgi:hypothetical protein